jgi:hypothetical protein
MSTLETGSWKVAESGPLNVIVDVLEHAAFAYVWDSTHGIRSHVWLFNCSAERDPDWVECENSPPEMPDENILRDHYAAPENISLIKCAKCTTTNDWILSWNDRDIAALSLDTTPGRSTFVKSPHGLAAPW